MRTFVRFLILTFLVNTSCTSTTAQADFSPSTDSLSVDNSIRHGELPNGFSYFIKSVPKPQSKTNMRLYNKAGSNQEDQDQIHVAHAVEHLSVKPTRNFPSGIISDDRITETGMGMYDLWGTSGPRKTTYYFDAPHGERAALDLGLLWFKDIMSGLSFSDEHIKIVGGELRQELIERNGDDLASVFIDSELKSRFFPCKKVSSNLFEEHENYTPETFMRFHRDWYRPELMAINIVGNIEDLDDIERRIKRYFSSITTSEHPRETTNCDAVYYKRPPQFFTVERPRDTMKVLQNNDVEVKLLFRDPITNQNLHNMEGTKRLILMQMLTSGLNKRLGGATSDYQEYDLSSSYPYKLFALPPALEILIQSEKGSEKKALEKAIKTIYQVKEYGFSEEEWKALKEEQLHFLDQVDTDSGNYWENEIERYYNYGEALPDNKHTRTKAWMSNLSAAEFHALINSFLSKVPEDIGIIAPAGYKALGYQEKEVRSWIEKINQEPLEPFELHPIPSRLMRVEEVEELEKGTYTQKVSDSSGAREFVLENGVKVVFKSFIPSSGSQSNINLHGFSLKGAKCFSEEKYFSAVNTPGIVKNSGVNGMSKSQINSFLGKTSLRSGGVVTYVGDRETGIQTNADLADLEIMLQLVFLYFTKPNKNKTAFEDWKREQYKQYRKPSSILVNKDFKHAIKVFLGDSAEESFFGIKSLQGTIGFEGVEDTDFEDAYQLYRELYGNPKDFTFIFTGKFDVESVLPLVRKYLGNLPYVSSSAPCSTEAEDNRGLLSGPLAVEIPAPEYYRMKNVNYGVRFLKKVEDPQSWKEQIIVEALAGITNNKAWNLRWEKGYSLYTVGVKGKYNRALNSYILSSDFAVVPEELESIRKEFKQIIFEIKSGKISEEEFERGLHRMFSLYDSERARKSRVMQYNLYNHYRYNQPWVNPIEVENFLKSLTIQDIKRAAGKYYRDENLFEFVMKDRKQ